MCNHWYIHSILIHTGIMLVPCPFLPTKEYKKTTTRTADVWEYFLHSLESSLSAMYICGTIILVYHHRFIHSWPMHTQVACYFLLAKSNNVKQQQQQQHCWYVWTCCAFLLTSTCHVCKGCCCSIILGIMPSLLANPLLAHYICTCMVSYSC